MNREQYEIWFIDYFDGLLTEAQVADLMVFLGKNPDLKAEFENYQTLTLEADSSTELPNKKALKRAEILPFKSVNSKNYETSTLDLLDGNIQKNRELAHFYSVNPDLKFDPTLCSATVLKPDLSIKFPNKATLRRRQSFRIPPSIVVSAIAASIALLIWFLPFSSIERIENTQIAIQVKTPSSLEYMPESWSITPQTGTLAEASVIKEENSLEHYATLTSRIEEPTIQLNSGAEFIRISALETNNNPQLIGYKKSQLENDLQLALQEENRKSPSKFAMAFNKIFMRNQSSDKTQTGIWKAVNWGIERYNYTTGNEIGLARVEQNGSDRVTYAIAGENFAFQRNFKKKED